MSVYPAGMWSLRSDKIQYLTGTVGVFVREFWTQQLWLKERTALS
jgi:hypothetical protein